MNKLFLTILLSVFTCCCSQKKFVIYNAIQGQVLDSKTKKPIKDVNIFVDKFASNSFDTVSTNKLGVFFIDGLMLPQKYLHDQNRLSLEYNFEKKGYKKKIIIIKDLNNNNNKLDTINVGNVYLEND